MNFITVLNRSGLDLETEPKNEKKNSFAQVEQTFGNC